MGEQLDHARRLVLGVKAADVLAGLQELDRQVRAHAPTAPLGARWWCAQCSAFLSTGTSICRKCLHAGPHHFGEDAPTTGQPARRARLRAEHRARKRRSVR